MRKLAEIGKVIGGLLLVFSAIVTFKFDMPQIVENIIYFRGIVIGSLFLFLGSAITTESILIKNILYSLAGGDFVLLIASTYNLIFDDFVDLDIYFDLTVITTFTIILILTIIRLWSRRVSIFRKRL